MTDYRTESVFFAVALALAVGAAAVTTVSESPDVNDAASYGTTGLAKQHQPLARALFDPLPNEQ